MVSSSAPDVIDDDRWIIHLCLWRGTLSPLLFSGVTGHSCESVDVTHSWTSTKGLLCVSGMGGGLPVWDRSVNIRTLVAREEVFLCEEGGQGDGKLSRLLCSVWFKTLNRHPQHWGCLHGLPLIFPSFVWPNLPFLPIPHSASSPELENPTVLFQLLSRFRHHKQSAQHNILRTYLGPGWEDNDPYSAAIPISCFVVPSCPMGPAPS